MPVVCPIREDGAGLISEITWKWPRYGEEVVRGRALGREKMWFLLGEGANELWRSASLSLGLHFSFRCGFLEEPDALCTAAVS